MPSNFQIKLIINLATITSVSYDVCVDDVEFQDCALDTPPSKVCIMRLYLYVCVGIFCMVNCE